MPRRSAALAALIAIAATAGGARADDDEHRGWPRRMTALAIGGNAQYLRNESIGGPGLYVEHALGRGRWQGYADGTAIWFIGDRDGIGGGVGARFGLGARWLARSFAPDSSAALEMFIGGGPGVQHVELTDGRVTRPDFTIGWGWQIRGLRKPRSWAIRFSFYVAVAPAVSAPAVARLVCRGQCTSAPSSSPVDEAFRANIGVAW